MIRLYLDQFNKDNRRVIREFRRSPLWWVFPLVFVLWAVAETVIDPPLNLMGEEAMREAGR